MEKKHTMIDLTGLAAELHGEIAALPVIDCHEHLPTEAERVARRIDFTELFRHYTRADLESAGLPLGDAAWARHEIYDTSKPVLPRWRKLKPCLQAIRHGSYAYPALAYVREVLGFPDITDSTVEAISERLQADNKPGIYQRLMQELCGIRTAIQCKEGVVRGDQDFFVYLARDRVEQPDDCAGPADCLARLERERNRSIRTLPEWVDVLGAHVQDQKRQGAVGLKIGMAYRRTLEVEDVAAADAERVFVRLRRSVRAAVSEDDRKILEDYLLRREIEHAIDAGLVVAIHTGYQAGLRNDIRNARATLLWGLLKSYPQARFDLFHGSFPYVSDMTVLGKYFPNVSLNMCWMHIMSPEISRRALAEWLDAVPATKIFAFGGDYQTVEKIYGHLQLARADVAIVLADKVAQGRMTTAEALNAARLLFHDNPVRWYGLKGRKAKSLAIEKQQ